MAHLVEQMAYVGDTSWHGMATSYHQNYHSKSGGNPPEK